MICFVGVAVVNVVVVSGDVGGGDILLLCLVFNANILEMYDGIIK